MASNLAFVVVVVVFVVVLLVVVVVVVVVVVLAVKAGRTRVTSNALEINDRYLLAKRLSDR